MCYLEGQFGRSGEEFLRGSVERRLMEVEYISIRCDIRYRYGIV